MTIAGIRIAGPSFLPALLLISTGCFRHTVSDRSAAEPDGPAIVRVGPGPEDGETDQPGIHYTVLRVDERPEYRCLVTISSAVGSPATAVLLLEENSQEIGRFVLKEQYFDLFGARGVEFDLAERLFSSARLILRFEEGDSVKFLRMDLGEFKQAIDRQNDELQTRRRPQDR